MTRFCTLAIALAATAPVALALPGTTALAPAAPQQPPATPLSSQQRALAEIGAQQLARAAIIDYRAGQEQSPADARFVARLLRDAADLDPTNASILRFAIDAAAATGDHQSAIDIGKTLVRLDPEDTDAQLQLIESRIALCQTAEERLSIYESLLGPRGDSLDAAVRSRLAYQSALLRRERADAAGFVKDLTAATTLDSSNYPAAALALEYYAGRVKDAEGRFELLTNTLVASPLDASIHAAIGHELAVAGATDQALRFYENARKLYKRQGSFLPMSGQEEYQVLVWRARGPQVVVKPLNDALDAERRRAQIEIDVANATGKPNDALPLPGSFRQPIAMERIRLTAAYAAGDRSTVDRSMADLSATLGEIPESDPTKLNAEIEAAFLRALTASGDISADVARLRARRGAPPEAIARLDAWVKVRRGNVAAGRADFEAMKDDQLAKVALAVLDVEAAPAPGTAQSRTLSDRLAALAADNPASPIGAWATTVYQARNEGQSPPLSQRAEKFNAMGGGIPSWVDDVAREPARTISVQVEPASKRALTPLQPAILNVRISNNTPMPVSVGPGLTVDDRLLISSTVDIGGASAPDLNNREVASIGGRLRLLPRQEIVFPVWADPGAGGWGIQNVINKAGRIRFQVIQGYALEDGFKPGPFGNVIDAAPITRASLPLIDPSRLAGEIATLQDEEFATAILQARLQLLAKEKPLTPEQAKGIVGAITDRYRRATSAERVVILTLSPTPRLAGAIAELERVVAQIEEADPIVARAALLTRVDEAASPLLKKYRTHTDPSVLAAVRTIEERLASSRNMFALAAPPPPPAPAKPRPGLPSGTPADQPPPPPIGVDPGATPTPAPLPKPTEPGTPSSLPPSTPAPSAPKK